MREIGADQVRVMTFVPQEGTPMAGRAAPDSTREMVVIAVLRLAFPDRLIPASLDVGGLAGLKMRLDAGANVVTSLAVPGGAFSVSPTRFWTSNMPAGPRRRCGLFWMLPRCGHAG